MNVGIFLLGCGSLILGVVIAPIIWQFIKTMFQYKFYETIATVGLLLMIIGSVIIYFSM